MSYFSEDGIRKIDITLRQELIEALRCLWKKHVLNVPSYPNDKFSGSGIVMCAGGISYFTCAWVCISNLRAIGCQMPIELWYDENELSDEIIGELIKLNVVCRNFKDETQSVLDGVSLKPLAIILSRFKHILFLDADNNCLIDPSYLFETKEYLKYGAIFWPDFWKTPKDNPIWKITGSSFYEQFEQESGQLLVNKEISWLPLNLALFFNEKREYFYRLIHGDKDTFRFAWHALKKEFYMVQTPVACCGYRRNDTFFGMTMVQHTFNGDYLFLHRNLLKWDVTRATEINLWNEIRCFKNDATEKKYLLEYNKLDHHLAMSIDGDISILSVDERIHELENRCMKILASLRNRPFYIRMLIEDHISKRRI